MPRSIVVYASPRMKVEIEFLHDRYRLVQNVCAMEGEEWQMNEMVLDIGMAHKVKEFIDSLISGYCPFTMCRFDGTLN